MFNVIENRPHVCVCKEECKYLCVVRVCDSHSGNLSGSFVTRLSHTCRC